MGGSWSAYWYNGVIVSSEIARGLDIYELLPSGLITENELAAAKTVKMPYLNTQDQQRLVWAPSFALARAYLDQLARSSGLAAEMMTTARTTLTNAERRAGFGQGAHARDSGDRAGERTTLERISAARSAKALAEHEP
jgi:hypothetical protein